MNGVATEAAPSCPPEEVCANPEWKVVKFNKALQLDSAGVQLPAADYANNPIQAREYHPCVLLQFQNLHGSDNFQTGCQGRGGIDLCSHTLYIHYHFDLTQ